jgi:hypothetical protein
VSGCVQQHQQRWQQSGTHLQVVGDVLQHLVDDATSTRSRGPASPLGQHSSSCKCRAAEWSPPCCQHTFAADVGDLIQLFLAWWVKGCCLSERDMH